MNPEKTISCGFLDQPKCDDYCLESRIYPIIKYLRFSLEIYNQYPVASVPGFFVVFLPIYGVITIVKRHIMWYGKKKYWIKIL